MEVENISLNATIVAEKIASSIERFGSGNFKGTGHRAMGEVMGAGALGIEITISGKIPSSRAKTWRFYDGYLKKCGDIAVSGVDTAYASAFLKTGVIGIQVRIMPPDTILPDRIVRREIVTEKKPEQQKGEKKDAEEDVQEKSEEKVEQSEEKKGDKKKAEVVEKSQKEGEKENATKEEPAEESKKESPTDETSKKDVQKEDGQPSEIAEKKEEEEATKEKKEEPAEKKEEKPVKETKEDES